jgi:ferrous iron transport protein B
VLLVGNPNVGKTALFNALTGERAPVGNYPGVTVEHLSAVVSPDPDSTAEHVSFLLKDGPGAYSLSAQSSAERLMLDAVLGLGGERRPDLVLAVVDAGQLTRNLYLLVQLLELRVPLVIALNMMDEVSANPPLPERIESWLGVPCVATSSHHGSGICALRRRIEECLKGPPRPVLALCYPPDLERELDRIVASLPPEQRGAPPAARASVLLASSSAHAAAELGYDELLGSDGQPLLPLATARDVDREVIEARYSFIEGGVRDCYSSHRLPDTRQRRWSASADRLLLHPVLGTLCLLVVILLLFQALFAWSDPAIRAVETLVSHLHDAAQAALPEGLLRSLIVEGIIGGVGNVVVFLPQIVLLFLFIGLLENSGYMARAALMMDRVMRALGLPGTAFVPMLSGYACAVPAILSTRIMERPRDRLLTMLVVPLMTCSARLPVYTLIVAALFPPTDAFGWVPVQSLLMLAMYVLSAASALAVAWLFAHTLIRGKRLPVVTELPPYRFPDLRTTASTTLCRCITFLKGAGTIILICTVVLWALLAFPRSSESMSTGAAVGTAIAAAPPASSRNIETSYAARVGMAIEPALAPLGYDWRIGVGLIGAFAGREAFVSTMALVYGTEDAGGSAVALRDRMHPALTAGGAPRYSPIVGLSLLVFFSFACQCTSTLATIRRETRSYRWPLFVFAYTTLLAYLGALLVYQIGTAVLS